MAETPNNFDNSSLRESRVIFSEILNTLKKIESANRDINKAQTDANEFLKAGRKGYQDLFDLQGKLKSDLESTTKIQERLNIVKGLQNEIQTKINKGTKAEAKAYKDAQNEIDELVGKFQNLEESSKELDKSGNFFKGFASLVDKVPILSALKRPFEEASKAARESAASQKATTGNINRSKASLAGMKKLLLGPAGITSLVGLAAKFFLEIDKTVIGTAKALGISKANARDIADSFIDVSNTSSNLLVNARSLVDATSQLSENLGATAIQSESTLKNQIFLTENLGLSAENASNLSFLFDTFNKSSMGATNSVIELNKNLGGTNGFLIPTNKLLDEIAGTSAEIQGYFGFSAKELANAVYQTRRFGISLSAANSIAGSLLNFEESIGNELQLELLTNRSLNFERARALAFTGDIAGASAEVLKQTQNLTEAQRRNPIILKAAADAAGLSVEELNKAFTIQKRLNLSSEAYNDLVAKGSNLVGFERTQALMMQSASREEFEKNLTIQQKLQGAVTRITQQFEKLVNMGIIDKLIDGITNFAVALADGKGLFGAFKAIGKGSSSSPDSIDAEDFTIRTHPKDTLVMAGGTKMGDETNMLLRELVTAVKSGGDVYIDGAKVGSSLVMAKTKLS